MQIPGNPGGLFNQCIEPDFSITEKPKYRGGIMKVSTRIAKTIVLAATVCLLAVPAMAGNGHGPGDGTGNGGDGPGDGTGNGPGTGDCLNTAVFHLSHDLLARGGGNGHGNGGHGPGDGTGSGTGPQDGTGNGPGTGTCVNT